MAGLVDFLAKHNLDRGRPATGQQGFKHYSDRGSACPWTCYSQAKRHLDRGSACAWTWCWNRLAPPVLRQNLWAQKGPASSAATGLKFGPHLATATGYILTDGTGVCLGSRWGATGAGRVSQ